MALAAAATPVALAAFRRRGRPGRVTSPRRTARRDGYLLKGPPLEDLLRAIGAVLQDRRHLGPGVAELAEQTLAGERTDDPPAAPSPREGQIISMVVQGRFNAAIGDALHLLRRPPTPTPAARVRLPDLPAPVQPAIRSDPIDAGPRRPASRPREVFRRLAEGRPQSSPSACQVRRLRSMSRSFSSQACSR